MSQKRSKLQVISQILRTCIGKGAIKTRIVYTTNMNFHTVNSYLITLAEGGLIDVIRQSRVTYRTTEKGLEALEHFEALEKLIPGLKSDTVTPKT